MTRHAAIAAHLDDAERFLAGARRCLDRAADSPADADALLRWEDLHVALGDVAYAVALAANATGTELARARRMMEREDA